MLSPIPHGKYLVKHYRPYNKKKFKELKLDFDKQLKSVLKNLYAIDQTAQLIKMIRKISAYYRKGSKTKVDAMAAFMKSLYYEYKYNNSDFNIERIIGHHLNAIFIAMAGGDAKKVRALRKKLLNLSTMDSNKLPELGPSPASTYLNKVGIPYNKSAFMRKSPVKRASPRPVIIKTKSPMKRSSPGAANIKGRAKELEKKLVLKSIKPKTPPPPPGTKQISRVKQLERTLAEFRKLCSKL